MNNDYCGCTHNVALFSIFRFCKIIKSLHSENFFWLISFIPFIVIPGIFIALGLFPLDLTTIFMFLVIHFFYWYFKGRKDVAELIAEAADL